jgi:hypothetical protein
VPVTVFDITCDFADVRKGIEETFRDYVGEGLGREVEKLVGEVRDVAEDALDGGIADVAKDLRKSLSVPVDKSRVPWIRSAPGEFPRLETGRLRGSVEGVTYRAGREQLRGVVATNGSAVYDKYVVRTRPYDRLIESKWRRLIENRLAIALR